MNEKKKILLVVDNPSTSDCIVSNLKRDGYPTKAINSDDRVVETIEQFKPKTILVDVNLTKTDASYLCRTIKEKIADKELKIVLIEHEANNHKGENADDKLVTPFSIGQLLSKIGAKVTNYTWEIETICE